ncbi:hypothetical protein AYO22_08726 [Fonsecaea multimorphosa]|nr:hypothetical protein AYO22_08726 [Fonsecaea multimorphosa]
MAILSEIVRFVLPPTKVKLTEFLKLRQHISRSYNVHDQYCGYITPVKSSHLLVKENEMCWVIQWPQGTRHHAQIAELRAQLKELTSEPTSSNDDGTGGGATSLLFQFEDSQVPELNKALEAPVCEFAIINLTPNHPRAESDPGFIKSMHKTYTDCYGAAGFRGGNWSYALNTNETYGTATAALEEMIAPDERRLACYYLGWDGVEVSVFFTTTTITTTIVVFGPPWPTFLYMGGHYS